MAIVETFNEVIEIHGFFRDLVTSSSLFCSAVYGKVKSKGMVVSKMKRNVWSLIGIGCLQLTHHVTFFS